MNFRSLAEVFLFLTILASSCVSTSLSGDESGHHPKSRKKGNNNRKHPKEEKDIRKYFQDIYSAQLVPDEKEFGHVFEDPLRWEQRFEKINLHNNRHQGKVKWGDDKGGYGEYYFDFNHGGDNEDDENENKNNDHNYNSYKDDHNDNNHNNYDNYKNIGDSPEEDEKNTKKKNFIGSLQHRHLSDHVEILPGYKYDEKSPLHGGNYRKLE